MNLRTVKQVKKKSQIQYSIHILNAFSVDFIIFGTCVFQFLLILVCQPFFFLLSYGLSHFSVFYISLEAAFLILQLSDFELF